MMGPKSNQFIKVDYPQPMDTLLALLDVLKDPKKFESQVKALKDFMDKANQTIETLGKAEKIDGLLADAQAKQAKVSDIYDKARFEAESILEKANAEAEKVASEAKASAKELMDKANSLASQASKDSADARDQKAQYAKLVEDAAQKAADIAKKEAELAEAAQEIERKRALLAQL